jgi:hypothetical protein
VKICIILTPSPLLGGVLLLLPPQRGAGGGPTETMVKAGFRVLTPRLFFSSLVFHFFYFPPTNPTNAIGIQKIFSQHYRSETYFFDLSL